MSVTDEIDLGEPVVIYGDFFTEAGSAYDPATIALLVTRPDGTTVAVNAVAPAWAGLTHIATGRFSYTIAAVTVAGVWTYTWTPANGAIDTGHFLVAAQGTTDGPCDDWCRPEDIFTCAALSGVAAADRDYNQAAIAVEAASRMLYLMADRKYPGVCEATVRPCRKSGADWWGQGLWSSAGQWWNTSWGWCSCGATVPGACSCGGVDELVLSPTYRVLGISSVWVDGAVLAATNYRVDDYLWLVRTDGGVWPTSQDLTADPHTTVDTFEVTFFFGAVAPPDGRLAAQALAAELYAACTGLDCALPSNLRSRARAGDVIEIADVADGLFGIRAVDRFLEAERYGAANGPAIILAPGVAPTTRRADT